MQRFYHVTCGINSQHYPLDTGYFRDAKKYENGKRNARCVADEIEALLANNGTTANMRAFARSAVDFAGPFIAV